MRVYSQSPSVRAGQSLKLCVEPGHRFRVSFYRYWLSETAEPIAAPEFLRAQGVERTGDVYQSLAGAWIEKPDRDWDWPWIDFFLDASDWPSGVYAVVVYEVGDSGNADDEIGERTIRGAALGYLDTNTAIFAVTPVEPTASIAYIVPIATFQAYNFTGGGCFYEYRDPYAAPSRTVTLRRPGCGIGGISREARDPYDTASPRQAFAHWDAKMIAWLRQQGFAVDCYTDLDLDKNSILVAGNPGQPLYRLLYRLMISAGHHEYWSEPMREQVQNLLDAGGNVAIFSGNTCYRKISFDSEGASITKENECWPESNEATLTGVSYSQGGGWWGARDGALWRQTERPPIGYTVVAPDHWVFAGVDLPENRVFGAPERLLGYECDGVVPNVSPPQTTILAKALLEGGWNNGEGHTATMVIFKSGRGMVFNAATTDWARVLGNPSAESYAAVTRITRNVVTRLSK